MKFYFHGYENRFSCPCVSILTNGYFIKSYNKQQENGISQGRGFTSSDKNILRLAPAKQHHALYVSMSNCSFQSWL